MKHTVIAAALFAVILILVVANGAFVRTITGELCDRLESLPELEADFHDRGIDSTADFSSFWAEKRVSLSYSIHEDELDRVDEAVSGLYGAAEADDFSGYCMARERLLAFLPALADGEKPTPRRLF